MTSLIDPLSIADAKQNLYYLNNRSYGSSRGTPSMSESFASRAYPNRVW
jgi:hypothetical protein